MLRRNIKALVFLLAASFVCATPAVSQTTITFDSFAPGTIITNQYLPNVSISLLNSPPTLPGPKTYELSDPTGVPQFIFGASGNAITPAEIGNFAPFYDIQFVFSRPLDYFSIMALDAEESFSASAYLGNNLIATVNQGNFIGFHSASVFNGPVYSVEFGAINGNLVFDRVVINMNTEGGPELFDNVRYNMVAALPIATVPPSLKPGDQYRLAFITLGRIQALSSDIDTYNDFVTAQANTSAELAALGTTWKIIGSTQTVDAKTNTSTDDSGAGPDGVPIFRLDGMIIANNYDDLWDGTIQNPLYVAQDGTVLDTCCGSWTGTLATGQNAGIFALGASSVLVVDGAPNRTDPLWVQTGPHGAENLQYVYGISGVLTVPPLAVTIDIKPGSDTNNISLCSDGNVPVAILGSATLDATTVDTESLRFAGAAVKEVGGENAKTQCSVKDVNKDGFVDLVCHFKTGDFVETVGGTLKGALLDGSSIEGSDTVNLVPKSCPSPFGPLLQ